MKVLLCRLSRAYAGKPRGHWKTMTLFYQKLSINMLIHVDQSLPALDLLPLEAKRLLFAGGFPGGFAAGCVA